MPKKPSKGDRKVLEYGDDVARKIAASLPPPQPKREQRIIVSWGEEEHQRIVDFANERGEKLAVVVRNLTLAALEALGR